MLNLLVLVVSGILAGCVTGIIPGIHINLISTILLSIYPSISHTVQGFEAASFIISMSITHTFIDSIPGIYLGAPSESHALTALPGHKMLLNGQGHNALKLTLIGSFFTLLLCIFFFGVFMKSMTILQSITQGKIGYILILLVLFVILSQKGKILKSIVIFLLSSTIGLAVLNNHGLNQPIFHMLSGFFGISLLIDSLSSNTEIPTQIFSTLKLRSKTIKKSVVTATIAGFFAAFTPGFGTSQTAIIAQKFVKGTTKSFLILVGGLNTANMVVSLCSFYILDRARNGSIIAIREITSSITLSELIIFLMIAIIAGSIASILALKISKIFAKLIPKISYAKIAISIIILITIMSLYFDSFIGLIILITSTSLGLLATKLSIGKNNLMGCLIFPTILFLI